MAPSFLSEAELREHYGAARVDLLADRDGSGEPTEGAVERAIENAEGRVRSELLTRFRAAQLPATPEATSEAIKRIVRALAWENLHDLHPQIGDDVKRGTDLALSELRSIARGTAAALLAGEPETDRSRPQVLASKSERGTFARSALDEVF